MAETPCDRCSSPLESGDLRCAVCGLATPARAAASSDAPLVPVAQILRCDGCGAAIAYDAEAQAPRCAFCTSVVHLERPTDPVEAAQWMLPFRVQPTAAYASLKRWLSGLGWFRPSDLAREAKLESLRPLLWPAWIFDARALVSWAADSNAGSGRADWAPHAGQRSLDFQRILVNASRGLKDAEAAALASRFDLTSAVPAGSPAPSGTTREAFDVQRSAARKRILQAVEQSARVLVQQGDIPGTRFRKVSVSVLLEGLATHRFALPTYVLAYRYRGSVYRALVHGQDAGLVVCQAPYSFWKIAGAVVGALLLLGALGALGLWLDQQTP